MLDDAADEAQVRPLLPIYAGCAVVVTSRAALTGLVEATPVPLAALTLDESRVMLREMVGAARIDAERDAVDTIVAGCEGIPIAVRIAAARLQERPHWPIRMLADRLATEPLAELSIGDLNIRHCLVASYEMLTDAEQRSFRTLALAGGDRVPLQAAVDLLGGEPHVVVDHLDRLVETRLLEVSVDATTISYRLGGLARRFADDQLVAEASTPDRRPPYQVRASGYLAA
jgi:hypothetical protein